MKTRVADEAIYVLAVLYHMRDQVAAKPEMFGPDSLKSIEEAIVRTEVVAQNLKASLLRVEKSLHGGDGSSWENDSV